MRQFLYTIAILGLLLCMTGCGQDTAASGGPPEGAGVATAAQDDAAIPEEQVSRGDADVINDPSDAKAGGAYVIEPKNPNDPKYQADPRLAGGG